MNIRCKRCDRSCGFVYTQPTTLAKLCAECASCDAETAAANGLRVGFMGVIFEAGVGAVGCLKAAPMPGWTCEIVFANGPAAE